jgi:hypothetical protein
MKTPNFLPKAAFGRAKQSTTRQAAQVERRPSSPRPASRINPVRPQNFLSRDVSPMYHGGAGNRGETAENR